MNQQIFSKYQQIANDSCEAVNLWQEVLSIH